jgi:hypothetical protein
MPFLSTPTVHRFGFFPQDGIPPPFKIPTRKHSAMAVSLVVNLLNELSSHIHL